MFRRVRENGQIVLWQLPTLEGVVARLKFSSVQANLTATKKWTKCRAAAKAAEAAVVVAAKSPDTTG